MTVGLINAFTSLIITFFSLIIMKITKIICTMHTVLYNLNFRKNIMCV